MVSHQQFQLNLLAGHCVVRSMPVDANTLKGLHVCCVPLL
jgi:hypothetical protein